MKREDEVFSAMFKALDIESSPPDGMSERVFAAVYKQNEITSYILEKLVKLSIPLSFIFFMLMQSQTY